MNAAYAVVISTRAESAVERADAWWRDHRPAAPDLLFEELAGALELIARAPHSGAPHPSRRAPGVRRWLLPSTRYHVYYSIDDASRTVTVRTFWHAMRGRAPRL